MSNLLVSRRGSQHYHKGAVFAVDIEDLEGHVDRPLLARQRSIVNAQQEVHVA